MQTWNWYRNGKETSCTKVQSLFKKVDAIYLVELEENPQL